MKYGNRSIWRRIISSPVTFALVFIVCGFLFKATLSVHQKTVTSGVLLEQAKSAMTELQARNADLSDKVAYLSTDEGIKSEIRSKFRAAENGESVAVIVDQNKFATSTATSTTQKSWWSRFWSFFGL